MLLLALCACNHVLGLSEVEPRDARLFDSLPDAQPTCPTTTGIVPRFSTTLHQVIDQPCSGYQTSASVAVAICTTSAIVSQGPIDMPLQPIPEIPPAANGHLWQNVRISPEGDVLYVDDLALGSPLAAVYRSYTHQTNGTWAPGPNLPFPTYGVATVPSRGPGRHLLFYGATTQVTEWVEDAGGTWHPGQTFDLGMPLATMWLSPDGLRALMVAAPTPGARTAMLVDRATIDVPFSAPVAVPTLPPAEDVFMSADCTRVYMSGAQSIFYALQI